MSGPEPDRSALNRERRRRELSELADRGHVDLLVIGGGVTGAGVALEAASRGLRVALVERADLAFGTSRWSSKLAHGGLRYLASGNVAIARESAVERGILMTRTAPHLVHPLPQLVPLSATTGRRSAALVRAGFAAGDVLRRSAGTSAQVLPRSRRVTVAEAVRLAPTISRTGLRGGLVAWDGQLTDDARLVVAIARTAAAYGASILTRVSAHDVTADSARLRDELTGSEFTVGVRAVVNATGVWAGEVDPDIRLRPSRGTHLVFPSSAFGDLRASLTVPVPGTVNRFVFALPAPHARVYVGLTDEEAPGPVPDVPAPEPREVDFLLGCVSRVLQQPLGRADVIGTFAGLRPLLEGDGGGGGSADLSRNHAVLRSTRGVVTVVGGKLTTYRKMAEDAVDSAVYGSGLTARPSRTRSLPLVGAPRVPSDVANLPPTLVARYGTEASRVLDADGGPDAQAPVAPGLDVSRAEFGFAVSHEGALTAGDILDRRTRIGLVAGDRDQALAAAESALESAG